VQITAFSCPLIISGIAWQAESRCNPAHGIDPMIPGIQIFPIFILMTGTFSSPIFFWTILSTEIPSNPKISNIYLYVTAPETEI
jgi:hypothetical protein